MWSKAHAVLLAAMLVVGGAPVGSQTAHAGWRELCNDHKYVANDPGLTRICIVRFGLKNFSFGLSGVARPIATTQVMFNDIKALFS